LATNNNFVVTFTHQNVS